ncbi:hypothetical protein BCR34DRAFT_246710 [Clohesyomyces aquaticus]|uniref:Uncharacterized protein n=1 Tax=Clohesyomyces aquaticus TaxID=1231657 RepID=A0A1Y1ZV46_9PLEO|nr:hypothetical protein BCR34DRAFT_246710 [Clohesyomyces aquaticus]
MTSCGQPGAPRERQRRRAGFEMAKKKPLPTLQKTRRAWEGGVGGCRAFIYTADVPTSGCFPRGCCLIGPVGSHLPALGNPETTRSDRRFPIVLAGKRSSSTAPAARRRETLTAFLRNSPRRDDTSGLRLPPLDAPSSFKHELAIIQAETIIHHRHRPACFCSAILRRFAYQKACQGPHLLCCKHRARPVQVRRR